MAADFLVNGDWLRAHRGDSGVLLVDTRAPADYWTGHLEGARPFDPFPFHHSDTGEPGLREFRGQLQWIFSALGISGRETVVFYENDSGMRATRCAWALEYMGHAAVRILDGGLKALGDTQLVTAATPIMPVNFQGNPRDELIAGHPY
ncbi:MAG: sulfurtransferase, partial [Candidatus Binataceae bacterium]